MFQKSKVVGHVFNFLLIVLLSLPCSAQVVLNQTEVELYNLIVSHAEQERPEMYLAPLLVNVARDRAKDLHDRNYFAHVNPDGIGPNRLLQNEGYVLPGNYGTSATQNYIESIGLNGPAADGQMLLKQWLLSPGHRPHLLGETSFYSKQAALGVGVYKESGKTYAVFLAAHTDPSRLVDEGTNTSVELSAFDFSGLSSKAGKMTLEGVNPGTLYQLQGMSLLNNNAKLTHYGAGVGTASGTLNLPMTDLNWSKDRQFFRVVSLRP